MVKQYFLFCLVIVLLWGCKSSPIVQFQETLKSANSVEIVIYSEDGLDSTVAKFKGSDKMRGLKGLFTEKNLSDSQSSKSGRVIYYSANQKLNELGFSVVEKCATGSFYLENNLHYYALSDSGYEG